MSSQNPKICPSCKKELPDSTLKVCPFCATRIQSVPAEKLNESKKSVPAEFQKNRQKHLIYNENAVIKNVVLVKIIEFPKEKFGISISLVTQAEYFALMGENPSLHKGDDDLPVESVSWKEAMEFCRRLTAQDYALGTLPRTHEYTLPTSKQWKIACRGNAKTENSNKQKNLQDIAWFSENANAKTQLVAQKEPNDFGIFDMLGNVWEWCQNPEQLEQPCRGGSWRSGETLCDASSSMNREPDFRHDDLGFRIAKVPRKTPVPLVDLVPEMVKIPGNNFEIGKYPITQREFWAIMQKNPSNFIGEDLPVDSVSWDDAMEFCEKLTARERKAGRLSEKFKYTLPYLEEWQLACSFSENYRLKLKDFAWCAENSDSQTHPVGQKKPNKFGIFDMIGNVWEWCDDNAAEDRKIICGGSFGNEKTQCSTTFVSDEYFIKNNGYIGFRIVRVPVTRKRNRGKACGCVGFLVIFSILLAIGLGNLCYFDSFQIFEKLKAVFSQNQQTENLVPESEDEAESDEEAVPASEPEKVVPVKNSLKLVQIPGKDFAIGKYEITQNIYEKITGTNPSRARGENLPVENVSWNDAMNFCEKLTARERAAGRLAENQKYTLPAVEQWQYACRAGTTTKFYSGNSEDDLSRVAWYDGNSNDKTHPIGEKTPNAFGLYDMHGNVWEWCLDEQNGQRANVGGGFTSGVSGCESLKVDYDLPQQAYRILGFRIVLVPEEIENSVPASEPEEVVPESEAESESDEEAVPASEPEPIVVPNFEMRKIPRQDFYIANREVTQAEYSAIMGENPSFHRGNDNLPVECVSWENAMEYCKKLTALECAVGTLPKGYKYSLPTGEQWKIACHAGRAADYYFGKNNESLLGNAWYVANSGNQTHVVGQKAPNDWKIYDMLGNVAEWISEENSYMGGAFSDSAADLCARNYEDESYTSKTVGFRVALVPTNTPEMIEIPGEDFSIGKYEITQKQYQEIMGENPSYFCGNDNLPVDSVSWDEAMKFCEKLTARERDAGTLPEGYKYSLPTSEQWEIACRAGTSTKFHSGDDEIDLNRVAWFKENSVELTHFVGQRLPNRFGLYDMHGNVAEWCLDGTDSVWGTRKIHRGGNWKSSASDCRIDEIFSYPPNNRDSRVGFRIVLVPDKE